MRKFSYKNMNSETKNKYSTLKNDLFSQKTESQYVPSYIKEQLQNSIDSKYGKHKYKGLFSQVSDENIEKNIPLARSVVESGVKNHRIATQNPDNLSKLIGGLAVFYAASDENKFSIADKAREAAYMDDKKDYGKHSERQATKKDKKKASLLHENMKPGVCGFRI